MGSFKGDIPAVVFDAKQVRQRALILQYREARMGEEPELSQYECYCGCRESMGYM